MTDTKTNWRRVALLLLLAAAVVRLHGAWQYRACTHPDFGIVALMAKHMAAGRSWPAFFYGQAYMGSLEPAISAVLCRVITCNGFIVALGTAICGFLALPLLYFWTREVAGEEAGAASVAFCIIGPPVLYRYSLMPRGGYALTLLAVTLLLWLATRWGANERRGIPVEWYAYALLGFVAGLGWWTNQLILSTLLTVGVVLLVALGREALTPRVHLSGVIGFLVGSLPFWLWNALHDWGTFNFVQSFGRTPFLEGCALFLGTATKAITGMPGVALCRVASTALVVLAACACARVGLRGPRRPATRLGLLACVVLFVVSLLLASRSHFVQFQVARYLLPLLPVAALVLGTGTAWLGRKVGPAVAWVPLAALVATQWPSVPALVRATGDDDRMTKEGEAVAALLAEHDTRATLADYQLHGLNFALGERLTIGDVRWERYAPYGIANEQADRVAVLRDFGRVGAFLGYAGGRAALETGFDRIESVHHTFEPPEQSVAALSAGAVASIRTLDGVDLGEALTDLDIETGWAAPVAERTGLTIELAAETVVAGLRLVSAHPDAYPGAWTLEVRDPGSGDWQTVASCEHRTFYHWSGPRPYWAGKHFRLESRFEPVHADALRIVRTREPRRWPWQTAEVQVFVPTPVARTEAEALPGLLRLLGARGIRRLYCDRWVSAAVRQTTGGAIVTDAEQHIYRDATLDWSHHVEMGPHVGLLARADSAAICREVLATRGMQMRETDLGPWILFDFAPADWRETFAGHSGLHWAGWGCLKGFGKRWAHRRVDLARTAGTRGRERALLEETLQVRPGYVPALAALRTLHRERGNLDAARRVHGELQALTQPRMPVEVRFGRHLRLEGVDIVAGDGVAPGATFEVRYYWRVSPSADKYRYNPFVHFVQGGEIRFQDDHGLLVNVPAEDVLFQPEPYLFREARTVRVPGRAPPGDYEIVVGVVDSYPQDHRLRVRTDLPSRRRAVTLPVTFRVSPGGG